MSRFLSAIAIACSVFLASCQSPPPAVEPWDSEHRYSTFPENPAPEISSAAALIDASKRISAQMRKGAPTGLPASMGFHGWIANVYRYLPNEEKLKYLVYRISDNMIDGEKATRTKLLMLIYSPSAGYHLTADMQRLPAETRRRFIAKGSNGSSRHLSENLARLCCDLRFVRGGGNRTERGVLPKIGE